MSSMIRTNNIRYTPIMEKINLRTIHRMKERVIFPLQSRQILVFLLVSNLVMIPFLAFDGNTESSYISPTESHAPLADLSGLFVSWTSRRNLQSIPITPGDRIAGDHIIVKAEWQPAKYANWTYLCINATPIPAILEVETYQDVAEIDTRYLGNNATCIINATVRLDNGSIITKIIHDVFLGNFFTPSIAVLSPNGGEVWTGTETIIWQAWDLNVEEHLTFDVFLASGLNKSSQLLASGLTETFLEWNFSGMYNLSTYRIGVRVSDGIYTSTDFSDANFTAGNIPPTSITETITATTTTTTTTTYDIRVIGFLAVLMVSSVFIATVAYYRAKKF